MPEIKENEKIITIPLRTAYKKCYNKRAPYAAHLVKDFLKKSLKADDVKIGARLNEEIWKRGIKRPPTRVRVKITRDEGIVKAELVGFEYKDFKPQPKKERKSTKEKLMERLGPKAMKKEEEDKKIEGKDVSMKPEESVKMKKPLNAGSE